MMSKSRAIVLDVSLTPDTNIYTAGDVVGGLITFPLPLGRTMEGGILQSVVLIDDDSEAAALTLYLFDAQPSAIADQAAFAPTYADLQKLIRPVAFASADYVTVGSDDYIIVDDINGVLPVNQLYGYLVCAGTPTYAAPLTIRLFILTE